MSTFSTSLPVSLLLNAILSALTGLLLALSPDTVTEWLDLQIAGWLRLFGLALIGHFAILLWVRTRPNITPWVHMNLLVIGPYPLLLLAVALTGIVSSNAGRGLLVFDATLVGTLAISQWLGLKRLKNLQLNKSA